MIAAIAALANKPWLVLMDKPTGNLDKQNSNILMQLVEDIVRGAGVSFIIATHNLEIVQAAPFRLFLKKAG